MKAMTEHKINNLLCAYASEKVRERRVSRIEDKKTVKESFFEEFAPEIDLFSLDDSFPEWVYSYRENTLNKIGKSFRVLCQYLKDSGIKFFIKYPIEIGGKWKFSDVYLPDYSVVLLLTSDYETIGLPCHSKTLREIWFGAKYRTIPVYTYDIARVLDVVKRLMDENRN